MSVLNLLNLSLGTSFVVVALSFQAHAASVVVEEVECQEWSLSHVEI